MPQCVSIFISTFGRVLMKDVWVDQQDLQEKRRLIPFSSMAGISLLILDFFLTSDNDPNCELLSFCLYLLARSWGHYQAEKKQELRERYFQCQPTSQLQHFLLILL